VPLPPTAESERDCYAASSRSPRQVLRGELRRSATGGASTSLTPHSYVKGDRSLFRGRRVEDFVALIFDSSATVMDPAETSL
jgi:hypothetical protein